MVASVCEQSMREIRRCCDSAYMKTFLIRALVSLEQDRVCRFCDDTSRARLINLQTATFVGGNVPISQALQIVIAQPTKDRPCIRNRRQTQSNETGFCAAQKLTQFTATVRANLFLQQRRRDTDELRINASCDAEMVADHLDGICSNRIGRWSFPSSMRRILGPRLANRTRRLREVAVFASGTAAQRQREAEVAAFHLYRDQSLGIAVGADAHFRVGFPRPLVDRRSATARRSAMYVNETGRCAQDQGFHAADRRSRRASRLFRGGGRCVRRPIAVERQGIAPSVSGRSSLGRRVEDQTGRPVQTCSPPQLIRDRQGSEFSDVSA